MEQWVIWESKEWSHHYNWTVMCQRDKAFGSFMLNCVASIHESNQWGDYSLDGFLVREWLLLFVLSLLGYAILGAPCVCPIYLGMRHPCLNFIKFTYLHGKKKERKTEWIWETTRARWGGLGHSGFVAFIWIKVLDFKSHIKVKTFRVCVR